jgi:hypothetical protein
MRQAHEAMVQPAEEGRKGEEQRGEIEEGDQG